MTDYYETLAAEATPIGDAVNANLACVTSFMCHENEAEAVKRGAEGSNFLGYSLGHYYVFGRHRPGSTDLWAEYQERRAEVGFDPEAVADSVADDIGLSAKATVGERAGLRGAMGTPAQVRDYLLRYEETGVDQVILSSSAGRNRHEHIMESLELFGREILPEFAEREERRAKEKEARLAPVIEAAMARKPATDHPPLTPDFEIPSIPRADADRDESNKFHAWLDDYAAKIIAGEDVSKRLA